MARRQVIVQLDDDLVAALDREAEATGLSRSELIRRGAAALLAAHETRRKEKAQIESYQMTPQDPYLVEAFTKIAAASLEPW